MERRPLCDKDLQPMSPAELHFVAGPGNRSRRRGFVCGTEGCFRQYEVRRGYYSVLQGRAQSRGGLRVECPDHRIAMYIAGADPAEGRWTLGCPKPGCKKVAKREVPPVIGGPK